MTFEYCHLMTITIIWVTLKDMGRDGNHDVDVIHVIVLNLQDHGTSSHPTHILHVYYPPISPKPGGLPED